MKRMDSSKRSHMRVAKAGPLCRSATLPFRQTLIHIHHFECCFVGVLFCSALADLNTFEYEMGGEFGKGSAMQYGEADVQGKDFSNQVSDNSGSSPTY